MKTFINIYFLGKLIFLFSTLMFRQNVYAQCINDWVIPIRVNQAFVNTVAPANIVTDDEDNIYVLFYFKEQAELMSTDGNTISLEGLPSVVNTGIARYDSFGNLEWANAIYGVDPSFQYITSMELIGDALFVGGRFNFGMTIQGDLYELSGSDSESFYASFNKNSGLVNWTQILESEENSNISILKQNNNGALLVSGDSTKDVILPGGTIIESTNTNGINHPVTFLFEIDLETGIENWYLQSSPDTPDGLPEIIYRPRDIATDPSGNIYLAGAFTTYLKFDDKILEADEYGHLPYIAKFSPAGNCLWLIGGSSTDYFLSDNVVNGIVVDEEEFVYFIGVINSTIEFDETILNPPDSEAIMFGKLNPAGEIEFLKLLGDDDFNNTQFEIGVDIEINDDRLYVTGVFSSACHIDSEVIYPNPIADVGLLEFDTDGVFLGHQFLGGEGVEHTTRSDFDSNNKWINFGYTDSQTGVFGSTALELPNTNSLYYYIYKRCQLITSTEHNYFTNTDLAVYPNPTNSQLSIEYWGEKQVKRLNLVDLNGSAIWDHKDLSNSDFPIVVDLAVFRPGIYVLQITSEEGFLLSQKVVLLP